MRRISQLFNSILIILFSISILNASLIAETGEEEYLAFAEVMPAPDGGMGSIIKNIKYPEIAKKTKLQGRVYVLAYIDEQGNCVDAKVVKGIGGGCDEAAVEAVKKAKFAPGKNKGAAVKVKLSLPIEFKLS
jgi:protein TonB